MSLLAAKAGAAQSARPRKTEAKRRDRFMSLEDFGEVGGSFKLVHRMIARFLPTAGSALAHQFKPLTARAPVGGSPGRCGRDRSAGDSACNPGGSGGAG